MKTAALLLVAVLGTLAPRLARAEDVAAPAPSRSKTDVHVHLAGGQSYGELLGLGAWATSVEAGIAAEPSPRFAISVGADLEIGKMNIGDLPMGDVALFGTFEGVLGRVRLGAGPQLSYFWMSRAATSSGAAIDAIGLGARARIGVDLVRFDDDDGGAPSRGIVLTVSPGLEWLRGTSQLFDFDTGALAWRTNATLGLRF